MTQTLIRAEVRGARGIADRMRGRARKVRPGIEAEMRGELGSKARRLYQVAAPSKTRRLADRIGVQVAGQRMQVVSGVADPRSGFHYTGVTRFGRGEVKPRTDRAPATVSDTRRPRQTGSRAALRFVIGGRVIYARRVKAYRPSRDWATKAHAGARREVREAGRRVVRSLA